MKSVKNFSVLGLLLALGIPLAMSAETGRLKGRIAFEDGRPAAGVTVTIDQRAESYVTGTWGSFDFRRLPPGSYSLSFRLAAYTETETGVRIVAGETTRIDKTVDWPAETVIVFGPSRRGEPVVEAPSAVTSISAEEIELQAAAGQIPELLVGTPGAEVVQVGVDRYDVNTRGFNDFLNTRLEVRVDGREISEPSFGLPTWDRLSFQPDDLERIEFLRGPGSALYGTNAYSGVLDLTSKEPRYSQGGKVRVTLGELATHSADLRWAGGLGNGWYARISAGYRESEFFAVSRASSVEYSVPCPPGPRRDCLPLDGAPLLDEKERKFGALRLDKYLSGESLLTVEGGTSDQRGLVVVGGGGRSQHLVNEAPWLRVAYSDPRWEASVSYGRATLETFGLATQAPNPRSKASDLQARAQTRWDLAHGRVRLVAGGEYRRVDPFLDPYYVDPATGETEPDDEGALFGHADWQVNEKLKLVAAARLDDSSFHDLEISPKAAVVYSVADSQVLRFTINRGFRASNVVARHIDIDVAPPVDLQSLLCDPFNVDCGLSSVPVKLFGNNHFELEESLTFEIGYSGVLGARTLLNVDLYHSRIDDFLSLNPLPQLGTPLGRLNDDFGPWVGPDVAENTTIDPADCPVPGFAGQTVADCVRAGAPALSNKFDGTPAIVALSGTNLGRVNTSGVDLALQRRFGQRWTSFFNYSWFDSDAEQIVPGLEDVFSPNTPEHKFNLGARYSDARFSGRLAVRWVDDFRWFSGIYNGEVKSYATADINVAYSLGTTWTFGVDVSNLLDEEQYQAFGGDLLRRRALVYTSFSWD